MSSELAKRPDFNIGINVNTQDVISIGVTKIEDAIKAAIKKQEAKVRDLKKAMDTAEKDYEKIGEKEVRAHFKEAEAIHARLLALFSDKKDSSDELSVSRQGENWHVRLGGLGNYNHKTGPKGRAAWKIFEKAAEEHKNAVCDLLKIRSKLTEIPSYERRLRAKVAQGTMWKTEAGREFLQLIENGTVELTALLELPE